MGHLLGLAISVPGHAAGRGLGLSVPTLSRPGALTGSAVEVAGTVARPGLWLRWSTYGQRGRGHSWRDPLYRGRSRDARSKTLTVRVAVTSAATWLPSAMILI